MSLHLTRPSQTKRSRIPARLFRKQTFISAGVLAVNRNEPLTTRNTMGTFLRTPTRRSSTTQSGASFDQRTINAVWSRATIVPGVDPNQRRKDVCGAWIDRSQYGTTANNGFGWEIDHIIPVSSGGTDDLSNLQPLQWQNNRRKGDSYPTLPMQYCAVTATSDAEALTT